MNGRAAIALLALATLSGCVRSEQIWHPETLRSGATIKVTSLYFVWGFEHDERDPSQDSFALEFTSADPGANPEAREQEVMDAFELIRPVSEQWNVQTASVASYPTLLRKGKYDLYLFERDAQGKWSSRHEARKVFAND